ncbi:hypothetical protein OBV_38390 [Oscillibacter valericigenes Sjm18-20]|nr:hypothetical protein OBV_38390 [Oscillibacter valericigenes Sjm18-20]
MKDKTEYHGTPDELANELAALMDRKEKKVTNRNISRLLLQNITELSRRGIRFSPRRSNGKRFIDLYAASPRADSDDTDDNAAAIENIDPVDPVGTG